MSNEQTRIRVEKAFANLAASMKEMQEKFAGVNEALANQRKEIAEWRSQIDELDTSMQQLKDGHVRLGKTVGNINIQGVRNKSLRLVRIMDDYENGLVAGPEQRKSA